MHSSSLIACVGVAVCILLGFSLIIREELTDTDYTVAPGQNQNMRQLRQTAESDTTQEKIKGRRNTTQETQTLWLLLLYNEYYVFNKQYVESINCVRESWLG